MEIWVKDSKTGQSWVLNEDSSKLVYNRPDGTPAFKLSDIGRFRFYPINPESSEVKQHEARLDTDDDGYQLTIFDF